ncbi:MAG: 7-carboxy-7-deazaguanine synthase QueE [Patescibacteria group bacterium]
MQVSEIFYSLQGEGINVGIPSVFLRLAGCNLRCDWCDSKFAQDLKSGKQMTTDEILKIIKKNPCKHIVITGGEPLLQQSALLELLKLMPDYYVELETNGSLEPFINKHINQYNCSPKPAAGGPSPNPPQSVRLQKFPPEKTYYKFVIDKKSDIKEVQKFIADNNIDRKKIFLMPQGVDKKELEKKSKWLAEICKKENLRFSPRLHIIIWGNKKGV